MSFFYIKPTNCYFALFYGEFFSVQHKIVKGNRLVSLLFFSSNPLRNLFLVSLLEFRAFVALFVRSPLALSFYSRVGFTSLSFKPLPISFACRLLLSYHFLRKCSGIGGSQESRIGSTPCLLPRDNRRTRAPTIDTINLSRRRKET